MGVPCRLYHSNAWPSWGSAAEGNIHTEGVREIIASVRWTLKRRRPLFASDPRSQDQSLIPRPPAVHIQALSFLHLCIAPQTNQPTPPFTRCVFPVNPSRNVALVMERMLGVCLAVAAASKRTAACRSASPAWTVDSSTASRRPTAPPPATLCVGTACRGKKTDHEGVQTPLLNFN